MDNIQLIDLNQTPNKITAFKVLCNLTSIEYLYEIMRHYSSLLLQQSKKTLSKLLVKSIHLLKLLIRQNSNEANNKKYNLACQISGFIQSIVKRNMHGIKVWD